MDLFNNLVQCSCGKIVKEWDTEKHEKEDKPTGRILEWITCPECRFFPEPKFTNLNGEW